MTLDTSKYLGGIGALLLFIGVIPYINTFGVLGIIGVILVLIALHGFASYYKERRIFNNAMYGIFAAVVGIVIAFVIGIAIVLPNITKFLEMLYPKWNGSLSTITSLQGMTPQTSKITLSDIAPFIAALIVALLILWIFGIITAFFVRRSLNEVSSKTSVGLFSTAGLLLLIGAVLTIIVIGLLLVWIAALLLAIAFFTTKPQPEQPTMATAPTPPATQMAV
ncbi:MAG TPA: DUF996 domain-containing protein [Candidatus Bathyarchaeia archaeon]|nr:DUF996 domain-containing protein [Candidatus Bathyarchaeia archaeon]